MPDILKIARGTLYDPANGIEGEVRDLWIEGGKIVAAPTDPATRPSRTIDAEGLVIMPGGVDMHCHIAGPKVNVARRMRPEERAEPNVLRQTPTTRSGTLGSVPSTFATGYKYAGLGYTTAFDAAVTPLAARHVHEEFADTPCVDKGFFVLMGNNHYVMRSIAQREPQKLKAFVAWLLASTKGFAPKLVNPGGVEVWKSQRGDNVHGLDERVGHFDVTPREILLGITHAANELRLPHPVHIHCNNLGVPGNWTTTLETMRAVEGHRAHFTHIQFHSYGGGEGDENTFNSKVPQLAEYVNTHKNITVDVGQVMFGDTTSMTGDAPVGYYLSQIFKDKWYSSDTEMESGCGVSPIKYRNKSLVHALQWAIGLEWYLLVDDPWRIAMSTDHPNGGSFLAYPQIIRLLMDRTYRRDILKTCPDKVPQRCTLFDLDREYSLNEIAIITRAAPARMLGLANKGHLGVGADADVTIYTPNDNAETMFSLPRIVIKAGKVLIENAEMRNPTFGKTIHVSPDYDPGVEPDIQTWFEQYYSLGWRNYPVEDHYLGDAELINT